jgi:exopolysaccharide biosynthesis polyprenyl glycosylphosphotransferase
MLLESSKLLRNGDPNTLYKVLRGLANSTRDTDAKGWFEERKTIGVIFTELGTDVKGESVASALLSKVMNALSSNLSIGEINEVRLSFRIFPENWSNRGSVTGGESALYEGLFQEKAPTQISKIMKRSMDVMGSLMALILGAPLFLMIATAVKLTSRGPVLFRQERIGQYGRKFKFLKFRSMYVASDESVHRDYVRSFIANDGASQNGSGVYKIVADKRVTRVGRFLRQTSLDELPQFINVLIGEMSLVGPRPPVAYEVECYRIWHRARLLSAKPGITGLWQVNGRSRVQFDDMVRMDLRYANSWSIWLDLRILLQTPRAVFSGNGAH